jgi:hypothetical protein
MPMHEIAHYTCLQAVIECGSDAKIVERRGEVFRALQNLGACFRKFLTAELPQAPPCTKARSAIFKQTSANLQKLEQQKQSSILRLRQRNQHPIQRTSSHNLTTQPAGGQAGRSSHV